MAHPAATLCGECVVNGGTIPMEALGTKEVAERLNVHPNTVALWQDKIGFQVETDSRGRKKFSPELVETLEHIKALRDEDAGYQTIRRKLSLSDGSHIGSTVQHQEQPIDDTGATQVPAMAQPSAEVLKLLDMMVEKDRLIAQLQEKLVDVATVAAQYQERSANLANDVAKKEDWRYVSPGAVFLAKRVTQSV
ncbi:MerR family transcriptional regulator [archaeon]|nr:MAG: MerR family transcriptional regulator [archaeon]